MPERIPVGAWGGQHVGLEVSENSARIEFDCAHGSLDGAIVLDTNGQFDVSGTYIREHGGPIRPGELPDSHPARYTGSSDGRTMTITVTLTDLNETVGPFTLTLGGTPLVVKCL